jgi:hypothetical protein
VWANQLEQLSVPSKTAFEPQRGGKDCVIASLVTATGVSYERIAAALGIALDTLTRKPDLTARPNGLNLLDAVDPLSQLGWTADIVVAKEAYVGMGSRGPSSEELKQMLLGRKAIIGYADDDPIVGDHMLAWTGSVAVDCSNGEDVPLDGITILDVTFLVPVRQPSRPDSPSPRL